MKPDNPEPALGAFPPDERRKARDAIARASRLPWTSIENRDDEAHGFERLVTCDGDLAMKVDDADDAAFVCLARELLPKALDYVDHLAERLVQRGKLLARCRDFLIDADVAGSEHLVRDVDEMPGVPEYGRDDCKESGCPVEPEETP